MKQWWNYMDRTGRGIVLLIGTVVFVIVGQWVF